MVDRAEGAESPENMETPDATLLACPDCGRDARSGELHACPVRGMVQVPFPKRVPLAPPDATLTWNWGAVPAILVWRFWQAPAELRALSTHGGDEDWLALAPKGFAMYDLPWAESGTPFGVCDVTSQPCPFNPDYTVLIGAHA